MNRVPPLANCYHEITKLWTNVTALAIPRIPRAHLSRGHLLNAAAMWALTRWAGGATDAMFRLPHLSELTPSVPLGLPWHPRKCKYCTPITLLQCRYLIFVLQGVALLLVLSSWYDRHPHVLGTSNSDHNCWSLTVVYNPVGPLFTGLYKYNRSMDKRKTTRG